MEENEFMIEMLSTEEGREELVRCMCDTAMVHLEELSSHLNGGKQLSKEEMEEIYELFEEAGSPLPKNKEALSKKIESIKKNKADFVMRCMREIEANYKEKISEMEGFWDE